MSRTMLALRYRGRGKELVVERIEDRGDWVTVRDEGGFVRDMPVGFLDYWIVRHWNEEDRAP